MKEKLIIFCAALALISGGFLVALALGVFEKEEETYVSYTPVQKSEQQYSDRSMPSYEEEEPIVSTSTFSPLTGLPVKEGRRQMRLVSLMIENTSACQPHYGINKAGILYECPVEGGITRLMGVFENYGGLERFGNVRSARPYYISIAKEFDSVYVHFGQSTQAKEILETGVVDEVNGLDGRMGNVFYRSTDKRAPHNAYTSTKGLKEAFQILGLDLKYEEGVEIESHFSYMPEGEENQLSSGEDAKEIHLYYLDNKPYFRYDEKRKNYLRYEFGQKEVDAVDGKQIRVKNILLQNVDGGTFSDGLKLDLNLLGAGEGKYISNGKVIDITWQKASENDKTRYFDASTGQELLLNRGKTFVCLIQSDYADKNEFYAEKQKKSLLANG